MCTNKVESSLPSILMEHNINRNCLDSYVYSLFQYQQLIHTKSVIHRICSSNVSIILSVLRVDSAPKVCFLHSRQLLLLFFPTYVSKFVKIRRMKFRKFGQQTILVVSKNKVSTGLEFWNSTPILQFRNESQRDSDNPIHSNRFVIKESI